MSNHMSPTVNEMSQDATGTGESRPLTTEPGKPQYSLIEFVEDMDRYCPGGYHPLKIGDVLADGRYRLVDKLGYGGYSTVWLARDIREARYVAVKVITADGSSCSPEANLMDFLGKLPSTSGAEIIPPLLDEFWVTGPNGQHKCNVTHPARMSLLAAREDSIFHLFPPKVAHSIIAQLIRGVAFLHSNNIVHADLHLGNILVQFFESIDCFSTSELYEEFGEPESEPVVRRDGKPLSDGVPDHAFTSGWYGVSGDELTHGNESIYLSDFGESFNPHTTPRYSSNTLPHLQPPEARFSDGPLSFSSDIWTLACTIWEIFGQRPLFEIFPASADHVTAAQVEALGILPTEWWKKWEKRNQWFNEEGEFGGTARGPDNVCWTWDLRFEFSIQKPRAEAGLEIPTEEERAVFEAMLRSMLKFRPEERATASEVLNSEWMKGWGQPALEESWTHDSSAQDSG
ncbi:unnamed protein product [Penicillium salamii]|uniref:non-specific serine/threonine protein kinase n=1 Tax=Penicillium salamii TaxID=1612424 RepID=A0A9W4IER7_9EURO|nr:unnamed protein product [Penicillium salamii]CAG8084974.1 unnamed protein product [Penicillium salamii]CAG8102078.1 unnamed protein product [Penicillium salamii]CAG8104388.1 unnamed protein product [Penicillium salamii]CAG8118221.1 unnamed protein product [Penicillium salamii]